MNDEIHLEPAGPKGSYFQDMTYEYYAVQRGATLNIIAHNAKREFAYGPANGVPDSHVGTFTQSLYDEAKQRGWIVVSMQNDWKRIFPSAK